VKQIILILYATYHLEVEFPTQNLIHSTC